MTNTWIIAQTAPAEGQSEVSAESVGQPSQTVMVVDPNSSAGPAPAAKSSPLYPQLFFIIAIFVVMYFIIFREPRRKQKQQQKMVQSLKKNDKVRTIGGILGTVVDIKGDEVILKIDENNNTKIRVVASAIGKTLESEGQ